MNQKREEINEIVEEVSIDFIESFRNSMEEQEIDIDEIDDINDYLDKWINKDYYYVIAEALRDHCTIISLAGLVEVEGILHYHVAYFLHDEHKELYSGSIY